MEMSLHLTTSFIVTFFVLALCTFHDIRKREVPNVITYSFVILGISFNIILSAVLYDYHYIVNSIAGFLIYSIIGLLLFMLGLWGGGDLKVVAGMGGIIGLDGFLLVQNLKSIDLSDITGTIPLIFSEMPFVVTFFIASFFAGAIIGIIYSIVIAAKNFKIFLMSFSKKTRKYKIHFIASGLLIVAISIFFLNVTFKLASILLSLIIVSIYLIIFVKIIEEIGFKKSIRPSKLTEGDWLITDIKVNDKVVVKKSNEGISIEEIKKLMTLESNRQLDTVEIKEGMPFLPSLLIGFITAIILHIYFI